MLSHVGSGARGRAVFVPAGLVVWCAALIAMSGCANPATAVSQQRNGNFFESRPKILTAEDGTHRFVAQIPEASGRGQVERVASAAEGEPGGATVASDGASGKPERNRFVARCPDAESIAVRQDHDQWCWAACAAMVLKYEGIDPNPDQMNIAGRFGNSGEEQAVGPATLMRAMNPDLDQQLPRSYWGIGPTRQTSTTLVEQILQGHPVIMGVRESADDVEGHLMLAYEVTFLELEPDKLFGLFPNPNAPPRYAIEKLKLIDPRKEEPVELGGKDLKLTTDFFVSQPMARQVLEERIRAHQQAAQPPSSSNSGNKSGKELWDKWFD